MKRPGRYRSLKTRKRESDYKEWANDLYNDTLTNLKLDKLRQICVENDLPKSGNKLKLSERIKKNLTYNTHDFVRQEKRVKIKCYRYDYISFMIGANGNFYEHDVLGAIEEIFPKEGIAIDIGGRPFLSIDALPDQQVGAFQTELVEEFFRSVVQHAGLNLFISWPHKGNMHHVIEALFKGFGVSLDRATQLDARRSGVPSTKGVL